MHEDLGEGVARVWGGRGIQSLLGGAGAWEVNLKKWVVALLRGPVTDRIVPLHPPPPRFICRSPNPSITSQCDYLEIGPLQRNSSLKRGYMGELCSDMTGVLIGRGKDNRDVSTMRKEPAREWPSARRETFEEPNPARTLIWDFQPPGW